MSVVLSISGLYAHNGNFLLKNINLDVVNGEIVAIVGENGSGKTTLLNAIAGFVKVDKGKILLNGVDITNREPEERNIGYIFQTLALFPHLTIQDNIKFGLRFKQIDNAEERFNALVKFFKLEHLLSRYPNEVSGGEKQKVAIARALILDPKVLLLDEVTSQLSPIERERVSLELKEIIKNFGKSAIFVTHNIDEATIVGDRIAVLDNGQIIQIGVPYEIFYSPNREEVARLAGVNVIKGIVVGEEEGIKKVDVGSQIIYILGDYAIGDSVIIFIHPEEITLSKAPFKTSAQNSFTGFIEKIVSKSGVATVSVKVSENNTFKALITRKSLEELDLKTGENVYLSFKITAIHSVKAS
jgi:molybdopterin-binding protein